MFKRDHFNINGWRSRGYLPHFDLDSIPQMVTFHLADSIPTALMRRWQEELQILPRKEAELERRKKIEAYLDIGHGEAWLSNPRVAQMVENALLFFDADRYIMHAWVVMPNHVHTLFTPISPYTLDQILFSWKSFTSKQANRILDRSGTFWFREYYDRFIRNDEHYANAIAYIEYNPVKANLCRYPEDWPYSSARLR